MINTPARRGPFDPLDKADPDQPFFPLMAGDPFAPALVLDWVDKTRRRGRDAEDDKERARLFAKANDAEEIAWAMQRWAKTGTIADVHAAPTRATYNDGAAAIDHRWKEQLTAGTSALRNAAFHFGEAAAGFPPGQAEALLHAVETINSIATAYEPKRASYGVQADLPLSYAEIGVAGTKETN